MGAFFGFTGFFLQASTAGLLGALTQNVRRIYGKSIDEQARPIAEAILGALLNISMEDPCK
jgi:hypothetical protein